MNTLKIDYKNDKYTGLRKYTKTDNSDGTISLEDKTAYQETGDIYSAEDINTTNKAVNDFYTEYTVKVSNITGLTTLALPVSGWSATAPYIQTITVAGMKDTYIPTPGLLYPTNMTEAQKSQIDKSMGMISAITTNNGSVTVECKFKKPIADLTLALKGV